MIKTIKIILADDEVLFRKGIAFILQREPNIDIIYEASNGQELVNYLKENKDNHPDIILMDLKMPLLNGVEATKIINNDFKEIKIVALSSYDSKSFIANMLQVGAASYLVKNTTPTAMIATINEVFQNGYFYNQTVLEVIENESPDANIKLKNDFDEDYITIREKEVLRLISFQFNTSQIAEKLFISPRTVDGHRNSLMLKTEAKNVAGLLVYALQNKIISLEELSLNKN
jgi:DNA-binding NarL/FixJ family response regulator